MYLSRTLGQWGKMWERSILILKQTGCKQREYRKEPWQDVTPNDMPSVTPTSYLSPPNNVIILWISNGIDYSLALVILLSWKSRHRHTQLFTDLPSISVLLKWQWCLTTMSPLSSLTDLFLGSQNLSISTNHQVRHAFCFLCLEFYHLCPTLCYLPVFSRTLSFRKFDLIPSWTMR